MLLVGPIFIFVVGYRFWRAGSTNRVKKSILKTNIGLAIVITTVCLLIGPKAYLAIQLPITMISGAVGIWLFYVQHQFEGVYWERRQNWDYVKAALCGSSFYKLPRLLQWFSGNIGFHHIHHLSPAIPNYKLEKCHLENLPFQKIKPVTLWSSKKALWFRLWDERQRRLVGYDRLRAVRREKRLTARD